MVATALVSTLTAGQAAQPKPADAGTDAYTEQEISFTSAGLKIPGTLCLPSAPPKGKPPIVVLVQGSGPHDRDETVGAKKPFADLAHGLAAHGIATLRYDKRTVLEKPSNMDVVTMKWEVEDDAVAALEYARRVARADSTKVFLLGHSLGAMLAPFIAAEPGATPLAGLIMLASPARPHLGYVDDQIRAMLQSEKKSDAEISATIEKQHQLISDIEAGKLPPNQVLQGAPVHYLREMIALDPAAKLRQESIPALVLQGGKDAQVFEPDFNLLKEALATRHIAGDESKLFPELSHMFMTVAPGETGMAVYLRPGQVAPEVIETIARWIHAR